MSIETMNQKQLDLVRRCLERSPNGCRDEGCTRPCYTQAGLSWDEWNEFARLELNHDPRYPGLVRLGVSVPEKDGIVATDMCDCVILIGAEYPACPHDLRGPKGVEGPAGAALNMRDRTAGLPPLVVCRRCHGLAIPGEKNCAGCGGPGYLHGSGRVLEFAEQVQILAAMSLATGIKLARPA